MQDLLYRTYSEQTVTLCNTMTTLADRLRTKREDAGYDSASEFARAHGFPEPTYRAHENGTRNPGLAVLKKYAAALRVDWRWLMLGEDTVSAEEIGANEPKQRLQASTARTISVDELDVRANGGSGLVHDTTEAEPVVSRWQMPADLVRGQTTAPPKSLKIITVFGDSMAPDFLPGERVLVDTEDRRPSPPGVFVLWDGLGLVIKRLEIIPGSDPHRVRLIPRNGQYQVYEQLLDEVHINGRVIGKWLWT